MHITSSITSIQLIAGITLLVFSVYIALTTMKNVSADLRSRWILLIAFLIFFILSYIVFMHMNITGVTRNLELIAGSIFLAGALFVMLMLMITRVTVREILQKETDLKHSEEKYRSLVESTDDSIYVVDQDMNYIFMNDKHINRLDLAEGGYSDHTYSEHHSEQQVKWFSSNIEEVFSSGEPSQHEYMSERDNRYFLQTMSPVKSRSGEIVAVSVISKNITNLKMMEEELRAQSLTDDLTGLYNRRGFFTYAEQQLKTINRTETGVCLLYVDLDYLKLINDNLGHSEGDRALVMLAEILKETFRDCDIIARIGGDEFTVFPVKSQDGDIAPVIKRLENNIKRANQDEENEFELSISTGVAYYDPQDPLDIDLLLKEADRSMYDRKNSRLQA